MRVFFSGVLMVLLCLVLCTSAVAETAFLPELESWDLTAGAMEVTLQADIHTHMPYDDSRTEQLNALLKHLTLKLGYQQLDGEQWSSLVLAVDGEDVISAMQRESGAEIETIFSSVPDCTYVWNRDSGITLTSFLGGNAENAQLWLDGTELDWLEDARYLFDELCIAMPEKVKEVKQSADVDGMGKTSLKQTLVIPAGEASALGPTLAELCPAGELQSMLNTLVFSGKQTLTLWRTNEGDILRADWNGNVGASQQDMREVSLMWRMLRQADEIRDDLTLKTPRVKGSGRNNLVVQRVQKQTENGTTLDLQMTENTLCDGVKTVVTADIDLERIQDGDQSSLTGTVDIQRQIDDGDSDRYVIVPDIAFAGTQSVPTLDGQLSISRYRNKNLLEQADVSVAVEQTDWLLWKLCTSIIQVDESNAETAAQRVINSMTVDLVRRLVLLPEEDTLFLSVDLDPTVWQQIVQAAQSALQ